MSKLAKFLGAAVFLISATVGSSQMADRRLALEHINFITTSIMYRASITESLILKAQRPFANAEILSYTTHLTSNMSDSLWQTENEEERIMSEANSTLNAETCALYFEKYRSKEEINIRRMTVINLCELDALRERLAEILNVTEKALNDINSVKLQAQSCAGRGCYDARESADDIWSNLLNESTDLTCKDPLELLKSLLKKKIGTHQGKASTDPP